MGVIDLDKRDKVIKGLECCSAYDYRCNDCPYQDDGGAEDDCYSDELYADALALLKAQEPRVMTPNEVQSCENAMWIELLGGKGFYAFVLDRMKNGIWEISTRAAYLRYYSKHYNVTWRCWTSRPSDEQMKAVKWE